MPATEPPSPRVSVPVSPGLEHALRTVPPPEAELLDFRRVAFISGAAIAVGFLAGVSAEVFLALIAGITNLSFFGTLSLVFQSPAQNHLGPLVILVPVLGGVVVGLMARYGSKAIRGHGIPEAMEQVLANQSRIPARLTFLKPVSAAISIGTGGPFGAEGPIIASGGALGSLCGQALKITADERKVLLASGAAAGMAAIFGTPVAAVLLSVELLLFEYRPRSLIPVALASAVGAMMRLAIHGAGPVFPMPPVTHTTGRALATYAVMGSALGLLAAWFTRILYAMEDLFARSRIHWMWWPAIGAVAVGLIGWLVPETLGVGYENIEGIIGGTLVGQGLLLLVIFKSISWVVALGSGTSGGTMAPLFTIGGAFGALMGELATRFAPALQVDAHVAGLVGMAAMFAGASHAVLASVVMAFETTRQAMGLLPILTGCSAAYFVSLAVGRHSLMTERLARRGRPVQTEYGADHLSLVTVRELMAKDPITLLVDDAVEEVRDRIASGEAPWQHQGFPVVNNRGELMGVVTRRDLLRLDLSMTALVKDLITRDPIVVYDDNTGREAADHMVRSGVGRLPVVRRSARRKVIGLVTRSDLLGARQRSLDAASKEEQDIAFRIPRRLRRRRTKSHKRPPES